MSKVYKTEEKEYGTIPDGDNATQEEIIDYEVQKKLT